MSNKECKNCHAVGTITEDPTHGYRVCQNCGVIVKETVLLNEVEFTELSNGQSSRNGQFYISSGKQNCSTTTESSKEGKMRIHAICEQMCRPENEVEVREVAERIFKKALHERFIRGRTIEIVAAACVYVAIRQKKNTGYLLVDVADHIDCGIFELAATALTLSSKVNEVMPVIDPTLYIDRFTEELGFGRQANDIKETAIRIIRRLDRDWIQTGRKPAGVCGAAIMLAARIHGIELTKETILKCARVCGSTINKRFREISRTELAKATINELRANQDIIGLEVEELPPAMLVTEKLKSVAEAIAASEKEETENVLKDDFTDDELADVDNMILGQEEMEKRSALFYTLYKSKLNQPPKPAKEVKPRNKPEKEGKQTTENADDGDDRRHDDDEISGDDFEDVDVD